MFGTKLAMQIGAPQAQAWRLKIRLEVATIDICLAARAGDDFCRAAQLSSDESGMAGEVMSAGLRTKNGFTVGRRCDNCGSRVNTIIFDDGIKCTLKCVQCEREYNFFFRGGANDSVYAWIGLAENLSSAG